jgi:hypothetical protein
MRAAKIRRGKPRFHRIPGVPQRNAGSGLRLRKYSGNEPFGSIHSKISVSFEGISAYFGKRSGLTLGSWHRASTFSAYFWDTILGLIPRACRINWGPGPVFEDYRKNEKNFTA